jgi:hypothetical protein
MLNREVASTHDARYDAPQWGVKMLALLPNLLPNRQTGSAGLPATKPALTNNHSDRRECDSCRKERPQPAKDSTTDCWLFFSEPAVLLQRQRCGVTVFSSKE